MKKKLKIKCIGLFVSIIIGIIIEVLSIYLKGLTETQRSYMSGFGTSFAIASFILLIKNIIAIRSPKELRKREIQLTDERNIEIVTKSMAISFRICIAIEAIASVILVIMNNEIGINLGLLVGVQVIVYCIANLIVSRKI